MQRIFMLVLGVMMIAQLSAQTNFKKALVVTYQNDTIYGWADFRTDQLNMQSCHFKSTEDGPVTVYAPGEIYAFRFLNEGRLYITKTIELTPGMKATVFVEYLVKGLKNLYYYADQREYYLIDGMVGELVVLTREEDKIVGSKIKKDLKYRGALRYAMSDYALRYKKVENVMFERASIVKLTRDYHDKMCTDSSECVVFEADIKKKFIEVEVSANLSANLFSLPYYFYNDFSNERTLNAILPGLNIDTELYSPRVNRNVGFIVGVGSRLLDSHNSFYFMNNGINTFYQYSVKANVLTIHLGMKYRFDAGKFRPSVEAAAYRQDYLGWDGTMSRLDIQGDGIKKTITSDYMPSNEHFGYQLGVRLDYKIKDDYKIYLKLNYSTGSKTHILLNPMVDENVIRTLKETNAALRLGYIF